MICLEKFCPKLRQNYQTLQICSKLGRKYGTELMQEYIDIGLERIQKLSEDSLKTRPIYRKIYEPSGRDSVSKYPVEWLEKRLHEIEEILIGDDA